MKYYPSHPESQLLPELENQLKSYRHHRNFKVAEYTELKSLLIANYFKKYNLSSAVVAVSGGIDSAVVLALLKKSQERYGFPRNIYPLLLPAFNEGVTNQASATSRGRELCKQFGLSPKVMELTKPHFLLKEIVEKEFNLFADKWASGQLVPYLRTPALYFSASLLTQHQENAIICGTTNLDEGLYLGYFGKASDGMVDIQVISDLHKSEVFKVAEYLKVDLAIRKVVPNGDMFDNRTDEQVFGASYDFVELFLGFKLQKIKNFEEQLNENEKHQWISGVENLENLHRYNRHKYIGHSPAVHLDLWKNKIVDGWKHNANEEIIIHPDFSKIVNLQTVPFLGETEYPVKIGYQDSVTELTNVLSEPLIESLRESLNSQTFVKAGISGYKSSKETEVTGSYRQSFWSEELSQKIFEKIQNHLPPVIESEGTLWRLVEMSSLFRGIKYSSGGVLIPHYDAPYEYHPKKKTLQSVVIGLSEATIGGETRFIKGEIDPEFKDWSRVACLEDVKYEFKIAPGSLLIFPHRILHDSSAVIKGEKIILRTDLVYEEID